MANARFAVGGNSCHFLFWRMKRVSTLRWWKKSIGILKSHHFAQKKTRQTSLPVVGFFTINDIKTVKKKTESFYLRHRRLSSRASWRSRRRRRWNGSAAAANASLKKKQQRVIGVDQISCRVEFRRPTVRFSETPLKARTKVNVWLDKSCAAFLTTSQKLR